MAITFVNSAENAEIDGADVTITLPSMQENDVVVVWGGHARIGSDVGVSSAGWTELVDFNNSSGARSAAAWKRMSASPDSSVTCRGSGNPNEGAAYIAVVFRGVDETTAIDATTTTATGVTGQPNSPSITTVTNGAAVISFVQVNVDDTSVTAPSGYGNQVDINSGDNSPSTVGGAWVEKATAGAEDPGLWSGFGSGFDDWTAATVALRPASTATNITPPQGNVALSTTVPTVSVNTRIEVPAANIVLSVAAPAVSEDERADPPSNNLIISGFVPAVEATDNHVRAPPSADVALSATVPSVALLQNTQYFGGRYFGERYFGERYWSARTVKESVAFQPASANLTLSSAAPDVRPSIEPGAANLTLSTTSPGVRVSIEPAAAGLTLSTVAPTVIVGIVRQPAAADLALITEAPGVRTSIEPAAADLVLSTFAPTIRLSIEPAAANLTLSAVAPSVVVGFARSPAHADLTLSSVAPSVTQQLNRSPASAELTLSATAPSVRQSTQPDAAQLALSTVAPGVLVSTGDEVPSANLVLSTFAPQIARSTNRVIVPGRAQLTLSTFEPDIFRGAQITDTDILQKPVDFVLMTKERMRKAFTEFERRGGRPKSVPKVTTGGARKLPGQADQKSKVTVRTDKRGYE